MVFVRGATPVAAGLLLALALPGPGLAQPALVTSWNTTISAPGTYALATDLAYDGVNPVAVRITASNVILDGRGRRIAGAQPPASTTAVRIAAGLDDVTVRNLVIEGGGRGVDAYESAPPPSAHERLLVERCTFRGQRQGAIVVSNVRDLVVQACDVSTAGFVALRCADDHNAGAANPGPVSGNVTVQDNRIHDVTADTEPLRGALLFRFDNDGTITVRRNVLESVAGASGILFAAGGASPSLDPMRNVVVQGNLVRGVSGSFGPASADGLGFHAFTFTGSVTVAGNCFLDNADRGIEVDGAGGDPIPPLGGNHYASNAGGSFAGVVDTDLGATCPPGTGPATAAGSPSPVGAPVATPAGTAPAGAASALLDADAFPDLAVVDEATALVRLYRNDGAGGLVAAGTVATGAGPLGIAAADFDGDSRTDLATADGAGGSVTVLYGDGLGGFPTRATVPTGGRPTAIVAGELDGVPGIDLAVADAGQPFGPPGRVLVLPNVAGAFPAVTPLLIGGSVTALVAVRLDADALWDLVAADSGNAIPGLPDRVWLFRSLGGGSFFTYTVPPPVNPRAVAASDLDDDGDMDLAVVALGNLALPGTINVYVNNGAGLFQGPIVQSPSGIAPLAIVAGDLGFDAPGDLVVADLAGGDLRALREFLPSGLTSRFASRFAPAAPGAIAHLLLADLDRDRDPDLVAVSPTLGSLLVYPGRRFAAVRAYGAGCFGLRSRAEGFPSLPVQPNPGFAVAVEGARPFSAALLVGSAGRLRPGQAPLPGGCGLLVDLAAPALIQRFTDGAGRAVQPIPIPAAPDLAGTVVWFQWGVFDPIGPVGGLTLSDGLEVRVGEF